MSQVLNALFTTVLAVSCPPAFSAASENPCREHLHAGIEARATGRTAAAENSLLTALSCGLRGSERTSALDVLGEVYERSGRLAEAEAAYRQMVVHERESGINFMYAMQRLSWFLEETGKSAEAMQVRQELMREVAQQEDADLLLSYHLANLAAFWERLGRSDNAEDLYRSAIAFAEAGDGPDGTATFRQVMRFAEFLRESGRRSEAEVQYRRAAATADGEVRRSEALRGYAGLLREMGREAEAAVLEREAAVAREGRERGPH